MKLPKQKRVTFILEASTRARNAFGDDIYSQILHMRLDGLSIERIASSLNCSRDLVGDVVSLWQTQVALKEGDNWTPRSRNPRRWQNRPQEETPVLQMAA